VTKQFIFDGVQVAAVSTPSTGLTERYVWGDGPDELIAWYEGSGTANRRFAQTDERGSLVAYTDAGGNVLAVNRFDEYGRPQSTNAGRFEYTGQMWLPELGLYDYKNRAYDPRGGRFDQADPIGYDAGPNMYNYVLGDPINLTDPLGLDCGVVTGSRIQHCGSDYVSALQTVGIFAFESFGTAHESRSTGGGGSLRYVPGSSVGGNGGTEIVVTASSWIWVSGNSMLSLPYTVDWQNVRPPRRLARPQGRTPPQYNPRNNYCGAEGGRSFPAGVWNQACYNHDICYGTIGSGRSQCDNVFLGEIARSCSAAGISCFGVAGLYWFAVRAAARPQFNPSVWRPR